MPSIATQIVVRVWILFQIHILFLDFSYDMNEPMICFPFYRVTLNFI